MKKITIALLLLFCAHGSVLADDLSCENGMQDLYALFVPKSIECNTNQFLPANSISCANCPSGYTCYGGEAVFDEQKSSGIDYTKKILSSADNVCAANFPSELYAIYEVKKIDCRPGYYLLANNIECTQCPENNYCVGGTYTFNETVTQGIQECPDGMFSPVGSWECYERLLHVDDGIMYLKSHKVTEPSLHVKYEDRIYYANMTTVPTVMTRDSARFLKIMYNSTEYYVCDDTTYKN